MAVWQEPRLEGSGTTNGLEWVFLTQEGISKRLPRIAGGSNTDPGDGGEGEGGEGSEGESGQPSGDGDDKDKPGAKAKGGWRESLPEEAKREVKRLETQARGSSEAARKAREELEEIKNANLTDLQRAQRRADAAEARAQQLQEKLRTQGIKHEFARVGRLAGAKNPDRIWRNIEASDIDVDENGEPTNAEELVAKLRQTDAYLFEQKEVRKGSGDGARKGEGPAGKEVDMNELLFRRPQRRGA